MTPPPLPRNAALFLDFDGCLVEIAPRPDDVVIPPALSGLLARLQLHLDGALALITGRHVTDLQRHLPGFTGIVAGSHGAEMALPGEAIRNFHAQAPDLPALHRAATAISERHAGLLLEPKPHGVGVHYRARPELQSYVESAMEQLLQDFPGMVLQRAKMAVELRPEGIDKAKALAQLMSLPAFRDRLPVYIGDDLTDEVAMAEAQRLGGFGIKVGEGATVAHHRLPDPAAVALWLGRAAHGEG